MDAVNAFTNIQQNSTSLAIRKLLHGLKLHGYRPSPHILPSLQYRPGRAASNARFGSTTPAWWLLDGHFGTPALFYKDHVPLFDNAQPRLLCSPLSLRRLLADPSAWCFDTDDEFVALVVTTTAANPGNRPRYLH